jgi:hypothetical protein
MSYRIEAWSHQTGWHVLPGHASHETRDAAEEWAAELAKPGRRPIRLPAGIRIRANAPFVDVSHITDADGVPRRLSSTVRVF